MQTGKRHGPSGRPEVFTASLKITQSQLKKARAEAAQLTEDPYQDHRVDTFLPHRACDQGSTDS